MRTTEMKTKPIIILIFCIAMAMAGVSLSMLGCKSNDVPSVVKSVEGSLSQTNDIPVDSKWVQKYWQELESNPKRVQQLKDSIAPVKCSSTGTIGHEVSIKGEQELFEKLCLKNGDIVWSLNDKPVFMKALKYWGQQVLSESCPSILAEIDRDGETMHINYLFSHISPRELTIALVHRYDKDALNPPCESVSFQGNDKASLLSLFNKMGDDTSSLTNLVVEIQPKGKGTNAELITINVSDLYLKDGTIEDVPFDSGYLKVIIRKSNPTTRQP